MQYSSSSISYNIRGNSECYWIGNILTEFQALGLAQELPRALVKAWTQSSILLRFWANHFLEVPIIKQYWKKAHRYIHQLIQGQVWTICAMRMPKFQEAKFLWNSLPCGCIQAFRPVMQTLLVWVWHFSPYLIMLPFFPPHSSPIQVPPSLCFPCFY